ncbi:MAG: ATP-binding cassette domain-containing protein [Oscillospiraceae bacterium]|nr:ATP-binding cassette domain-containing protein [Oscillospiraceae bacterium]
MDYVLTTNAVSKRYRKIKALDSVTMHIPAGAIYGFVGRNGAGKTTLIRIICGLQEPSAGSFTLYGTPHTESKIAAVRRRVGAIIETPAFYGDMNAVENMKMQYAMLGLPSNDGIDDLLKLVRLHDTGTKKARDFSLGMKQRLGIALALCGNPDFLILDEPINGLDPQGIVEIRELILRLNRERNITVLISSHILEELAKLATHYGFIDKGKIVQEISAEELDAKCRKYLHVTVTDTETLPHVMDGRGMEYEIISETEANLYGSFRISDLSAALAKENCELISATEYEESLENYFINLVGGDGGDQA